MVASWAMAAQAAVFQALMRLQTQQRVWFGGGPPIEARRPGDASASQPGRGTAAARRIRHKSL
eukprot:3895526-Prorocentrum_lima.AAC.1